MSQGGILDVQGATPSIPTQFTTNSGSAVPASNILDIVGTGNVTTSGATNVVTITLTGLTQYSTLVGNTSTITPVGPSSTAGQIFQSQGLLADPAFSTATYPSTTTVNQLLYSSATNVVSGLATATGAVLTTGATGIPVLTQLNNGQVIIGTTGGAANAANLTPGAGISIVNAAGSITISATTGAFTWTDVSGAVTAVAENGYFITATCTSTLPAAPNQGDTVKYIVDTTQFLTIQAAGTQLIRVGSTVSAAGGTSVSSARGDAMELVYRSTGTVWIASSSPSGAWTTA